MTAAYELNQKMQVLWQKYLPEMHARLGTVHSAVEALSDGSLSHELRNAAANAAHKLAGSLGTFGVHEGSVAAHEIERLLSARTIFSESEILRLQELASQLQREVENR
ncbi:MAG TPA: Hpt domain-containing protein [Terriglobales bacterium]|nr:Hpt domain-containing protein [Terriglobales bacterium]